MWMNRKPLEFKRFSLYKFILLSQLLVGRNYCIYTKWSDFRIVVNTNEIKQQTTQGKELKKSNIDIRLKNVTINIDFDSYA